MNAGLIDLYLAASMCPSEDLAARMKKASVDLPTAQDVGKRADKAVFANPHHARRVDLIHFFGPPCLDDPFGTSYDLALWPLHRFRWNVSDRGMLCPGGFVLRAPEALPEVAPAYLMDATEIFREWHHTTDDVEAVLGSRDGDLNWFPQDLWLYGPLPDGQDWCFTFDIGLLRSITREPSRVV